MRQCVSQIDAFKDSFVDILKSDPLLSQENYQFKIDHIVKSEVWVVDDFFSEETCKELIKKVCKLGFQEAPLTIGIGIGVMDKSVRSCTRVMIDDFESAQFLYQKLKPLVPLCYEGAYFDSLNERFRFLKYEEGEFFKEHCDGRYPKNEQCVSMATIHLYLNTVENGGETIFFDGKNIFKWENRQFKCKSKTGRAGLFRQRGWVHCGDKILKGTKFSLRNDLMYRWLPQNEINQKREQLLKEKCGICQQNIQIVQLQCKHEIVKVKCGCNIFGLYQPETELDCQFC